MSKKEPEKGRRFSKIANVARLSSAVRRRKSGESQTKESSDVVIGADEVIRGFMWVAIVTDYG